MAAALEALERGLRAAGLDVHRDGMDVTMTPTALWKALPLESEGKAETICDLDVPGTDIVFTLGDQECLRVEAHDTPVPGRWWIDTPKTRPFSVPAVAGEELPVRISVVCGKIRRDLVRGVLTVPSDLHNVGAPGTLILTDPDNTFVFLHLAEVAGERRYIAAHASIGLT